MPPFCMSLNAAAPAAAPAAAAAAAATAMTAVCKIHYIKFHSLLLALPHHL